MASQEHLDILRQGVEIWNQWRTENPTISPDLNEADLREIDLGGRYLGGFGYLSVNLSQADLRKANLMNVKLNRADLRKANLGQANLRGADLSEATIVNGNLSKADLREANLDRADLNDADLCQADLSNARLRQTSLNQANLNQADLRDAYLFKARLRGASLSHANLYGAVLAKANLTNAILCNACLDVANLNEALLRGADLQSATLISASLVGTDLSEARLINCSIFGTSAWNINLEKADQSNLIITSSHQSTITVDNFELAQFIYLLLNNKGIRNIIDTITSKVVLILGRFTPERKVVLDAIRDELGKHNYTPILFDFEKPDSRDLTETVGILAHLARFIIVDLTDPSSAPHEVATVIPQTVVPVQPLLLREPLMVDGKLVERREYAMFEDLRRRYHWVLPTFFYQDTNELLTLLQTHIIAPAEQKAKELTLPK